MSKRLLAGLAIAAFAAMPMAGHAGPGPEGCATAAGTDSGTVTESPAYGIIGGGSFKVERTRMVNGQPVTVTLVEREHAAPEAILDADIQAGDTLICTALEGFVVAGKAV